MFVGYRQELRSAGIFELPLNLKRNHFSYAHTERDVEALIPATHDAVQSVLTRRRAAREVAV